MLLQNFVQELAILQRQGTFSDSQLRFALPYNKMKYEVKWNAPKGKTMAEHSSIIA
jgi:hypothetical protein